MAFFDKFFKKIGQSNSKEVQFDRKEKTQDATYEIYKAQDAESAKLFLSTKNTDHSMYFIVVETPEGNWGLDKYGLYLEHLLPFQLYTDKAECKGSICSTPNMAGLEMAANGINESFVNKIECGKCKHQWMDAVRYQNETAVRCPMCKTINVVNTTHIYHLTTHNYKLFAMFLDGLSEENRAIAKKAMQSINLRNEILVIYPTDTAFEKAMLFAQNLPYHYHPIGMRFGEGGAIYVRFASMNKDEFQKVYNEFRQGSIKIYAELETLTQTDSKVKDVTSPVPSIDAKATERLKVLSESMKADDITVIRELIKAGADVNVKNKYGITPLFIASQNGYVEIVKLLLEAKADVNVVRKTDGVTPLLMVSQEGHTEIVKLLLEAKADVNAADTDGLTPLFLASEEGYVKIVKLLLEAKADVNIVHKTAGVTPLWQASWKNHPEIVKLLLEAKANVNTARKTDDITPLFIASQNGYAEVVKLLLEAKADVNAIDKTYGITPLCKASCKGEAAIVKLLLEAKADVDAAYSGGITPLFMASQEGYTEIVKLLLEAKADVNTAITDNRTPLWIASQEGHTEVVKLLIGAKADVNVVDKKFGTTPLWVASGKNHIEVVKLLLEAKADVNAADKDGVNSLWVASLKGHTEVVKLLLAAKTDANTADTDNHTPLFKGQPPMMPPDWVKGEPNPKVNLVDVNGNTVSFLCPTCGTKIEVSKSEIEDRRGAVRNCNVCSDFFYISGSPPYHEGQKGDSVTSSVLVPIKEFSEWFQHHPVCVELDRKQWILNEHGLWSICAKCNEPIYATVLTSFNRYQTLSSLGIQNYTFAANSEESSRVMESLQKGFCGRCGSSSLCVIIVKIPDLLYKYYQDLTGN